MENTIRLNLEFIAVIIMQVRVETFWNCPFSCRMLSIVTEKQIGILKPKMHQYIYIEPDT